LHLRHRIASNVVVARPCRADRSLEHVAKIHEEVRQRRRGICGSPTPLPSDAPIGSPP
jgi:hypothetical protein